MIQTVMAIETAHSTRLAEAADCGIIRGAVAGFAGADFNGV
jgi:hypothetical protein